MFRNYPYADSLIIRGAEFGLGGHYDGAGHVSGWT